MFAPQPQQLTLFAAAPVRRGYAACAVCGMIGELDLDAPVCAWCVESGDRTFARIAGQIASAVRHRCVAERDAAVIARARGVADVGPLLDRIAAVRHPDARAQVRGMLDTELWAACAAACHARAMAAATLARCERASLALRRLYAKE